MRCSCSHFSKEAAQRSGKSTTTLRCKSTRIVP
jgi:hypothetical protein